MRTETYCSLYNGKTWADNPFFIVSSRPVHSVVRWIAHYMPASLVRWGWGPGPCQGTTHICEQTKMPKLLFTDASLTRLEALYARGREPTPEQLAEVRAIMRSRGQVLVPGPPFICPSPCSSL